MRVEAGRGEELRTRNGETSCEEGIVAIEAYWCGEGAEVGGYGVVGGAWETVVEEVNGTVFVILVAYAG